MDETQQATTTSLDRKPAGLSPGAAILLGVWVGLAAGYLDLLLIVGKRLFVNKEGSFRAPRDFLWTVPLGHVVLAMALALVLAAISLGRRGRVSLRWSVVLLATLAFWGALSRLSIHLAAGAVLALGLGKVLGDLAAGLGFGLRRRWVRASLGVELAVLALMFAISTGHDLWTENRAVAALPAGPRDARNVLLVVWDTVRAAELSAYGNPLQTTPNLARWARRGVIFNRAMAPAPWTIPSHSSFFTGRWPLQINSQWKYELETPDPTLAEFLAARGYQTAGFAANTNCCNYETGLDRGFQHYEDYELAPRSLLTRTVPGKWLLEQFYSVLDNFERKWVDIQSRRGADVSASFLDWLGRRRTDRPFFAYLNYFDVHDPYIPPKGYEGRFGIAPKSREDYQKLFDFIGSVKNKLSVRDLTLGHNAYLDCITYVDDQLGRLLDELERRGELDDTVVIITSDHGEGFGEHSIFGHSYSVFLEEISVPLVILAPRVPAGRKVQAAVSLRDLPATVVDLLGLEADSPFPGRSLADHWHAPAGAVALALSSPVLSEQASASTFEVQTGADPKPLGFMYSLVTPDGYQYIRNFDGDERVYNLWTDPWAQSDLIGSPVGKDLLPQFRRMLLKVLTENPGTAEVERIYLAKFRRDLAALIENAEPDRVAARPSPEVDRRDRSD